MDSNLYPVYPKLQLEHRYLSKRAINIFELISSHDWDKLKRSLRMSLFFRQSCVASCSGPCAETCRSTHSALHYACQFRPPLDVVKLLYRIYPQALFERDCKQRYVLHIACKHGCSPFVIEYLLKKNPEAAKARDIKDRTPFLHLFKSYVFRSDRQERRASKDLLDIANALHNLDPKASTNEDDNGYNALEYAITKELPIEIVNYAQHLFLKENMQSQRRLSFINDSGEPISSDIMKANMIKLCEMKQYILPRILGSTSVPIGNNLHSQSKNFRICI